MRVYYDRDADLNLIKSKKVAIAYAELPALEVVKEKYKAAAKDVGLDVVAELDPQVDERLGRKDTLDALLGANEAFARGDLGAARLELSRAQSTIDTRRRRSVATPGSAIDNEFEQQLQALNKAQESFDEAEKESPRPASAPRSSKGKKAIRSNAQAANPFL